MSASLVSNHSDQSDQSDDSQFSDSGKDSKRDDRISNQIHQSSEDVSTTA